MWSPSFEAGEGRYFPARGAQSRSTGIARPGCAVEKAYACMQEQLAGSETQHSEGHFYQLIVDKAAGLTAKGGENVGVFYSVQIM